MMQCFSYREYAESQEAESVLRSEGPDDSSGAVSVLGIRKVMTVKGCRGCALSTEGSPQGNGADASFARKPGYLRSIRRRFSSSSKLRVIKGSKTPDLVQGQQRLHFKNPAKAYTFVCE